jgi:hypothetical protein
MHEMMMPCFAQILIKTQQCIEPAKCAGIRVWCAARRVLHIGHHLGDFTRKPLLTRKDQLYGVQ